ncbi:hypothetical protein GE061_014684 [Apolygus lucorum]|uniref:Uncharacterized protein n=1 Tax=Apolygus lucorum TaxID=248454 RepID=A0A8S9XIX1_APOLU|nr:hypothetical protein GE061_014684 [Apolygus lucorum]
MDGGKYVVTFVKFINVENEEKPGDSRLLKSVGVIGNVRFESWLIFGISSNRWLPSVGVIGSTQFGERVIGKTPAIFFFNNNLNLYLDFWMLLYSRTLFCIFFSSISSVFSSKISL